MASQFSLLLDELAEAERRRERPDETRFRKSQDSDWVEAWASERAVRRGNLRRLDPILRKLDAISADARVAARSVLPSPRETFAKAYSTFTTMVQAGQFTAIDAARLEAAFHHAAERL